MIGFHTEQVITALAKDNAQRPRQSWQSDDLEVMHQNSEGPSLFDPQLDKTIDSNLEYQIRSSVVLCDFQFLNVIQKNKKIIVELSGIGKCKEVFGGSKYHKNFSV